MSSQDTFNVAVTGSAPFMEFDYNTSLMVRNALPEVIERGNPKKIRIFKYARVTHDTYEDVRRVSKEIWGGERSLFLPELRSGETEGKLDISLILHLGMVALGWSPDQFRFETVARRDGYELPGEDHQYVDSKELKELGLPETLNTSFDIEALWRKVKEKFPQEQGEGKAPFVAVQTKKVDSPALLGITVKKEDNLAEWYQQVLTKGGMISYYDVSGCYILKPWSWSIWKKIEAFFTERIEVMGVEDCNFPLFISQDNLQREKDHIEGFAAEVAWVTHGGTSRLEKPIAIRPTSETAMYGHFAKEIRSHRDLPYRLNQWTNIVRWEFKHPMPFLRTREFHWQEGHTAHLTEEEAGKEVLQILDHYANIYEYLLAVPVVKGKKTQNEQFPGADYTTTIEGFIPASGRGIQAATSHCLGQHFSKMFNIKVEDPSITEGGEKGSPKYVWQTSWGCTTRSIGVMVLTHGDNKGLVLPPRVAKIQVIIIPAGITIKTTTDSKNKLYKQIENLEETLRTAGIRVKTDLREGYSPGWKFSHWELQGVPLRLEFGPKDSSAGTVTTSRRDRDEKSQIPLVDVKKQILATLETIQADMFDKADKTYRAHRMIVTDWKEFVPTLNAKHLCLIPHCLDGKCENEIKEISARKEGDMPEDVKVPSMGAKSLCIPFEQPEGIVLGETMCTNPNCKQSAQKWVMFGRSY